MTLSRSLVTCITVSPERRAGALASFDNRQHPPFFRGLPP
jgi:hypothetical protein